MNDYSKRALFYQYEFNTAEDFQLIQSLMSYDKLPLAEIPCGSGRLIPLHEKHMREVYLIDLEKNMISQCEKQIQEKRLYNRICAIQDDMRYWKSPVKLSLILIPRGGIQLLPVGDIRIAISNLSESLISGGLLYLDVSDPWNSMGDQLQLPSFMRFGLNSEIFGKSMYNLGESGRLYRTFKSYIRNETIKTTFAFEAYSFDTEEKIQFTESYIWSKLSIETLSAILTDAKLKTIKLYGNYHLAPHSRDSSRIICVAEKL